MAHANASRLLEEAREDLVKLQAAIADLEQREHLAAQRMQGARDLVRTLEQANTTEARLEAARPPRAGFLQHLVE